MLSTCGEGSHIVTQQVVLDALHLSQIETQTNYQTSPSFIAITQMFAQQCAKLGEVFCIMFSAKKNRLRVKSKSLNYPVPVSNLVGTGE